MRLGWLAATLLLALSATAAWGLAPAEKDKLLESIGRGYREAARELGDPDKVPNLIAMLQQRFPADLDTILDDIGAAMKQSTAGSDSEVMAISRRLLGRRLIAIQKRDGAKIRSAPVASLRRLIELRHDIFARLSEVNAAGCLRVFAGSAPVPAVDPQTKLLFLQFNQQLYGAIADGRDSGAAPPAETQNEDYLAVVHAMQAKGFALSDIALLGHRDKLAADAAKACRLLVGFYDAVLAQTDERGRRWFASLASEFITTDEKTFDQPAGTAPTGK